MTSTVSSQPAREPSIHELDGLLGFIPVAGPPVALLVAPLVAFGLLLAGPFLAMVTLVVVLALAVVLVALTGAVLASPFLLVHYVRGHGLPHVAAPAFARRLAQVAVRPRPRPRSGSVAA